MPSPPYSYKVRLIQTMLNMTAKSGYGLENINILNRFYIAIKLVDYYDDPINKLLDVGIICDWHSIAFNKETMYKYFSVSKLVFYKNLQRENVIINDCRENDMSSDFKEMVGKNNISKWSYFRVPADDECRNGILSIIKKTNCAIHSITFNIKTDSNNRDEKGLGMTSAAHGRRHDKIERCAEVPSANDNEFSDKLPRFVRKEAYISPSERPFFIRVTLNEKNYNNEYVVRIDRTEPEIPSIFSDQFDVKW